MQQSAKYAAIAYSRYSDMPRGYVTRPSLNLEGPIHISEMAEDKAVEFVHWFTR